MPFTVPVLPEGVDPAWLPQEAFRPLGGRFILIRGPGPLVETVHGEVAEACGSVVVSYATSSRALPGTTWCWS